MRTNFDFLVPIALIVVWGGFMGAFDWVVDAIRAWKQK